MSKNFNGIIRYSDSPRINSVDRAQRQNSIDNTTNSTSKAKIIKRIIIGAVICFIIAVVAIIAILLTRKPDPPPIVEPPTTITTTTNNVNLEDEERKLGSEFEFNTKKGDLKRIHVKQKYTENRVREGEKITTFSFRDTNYDIYIIDEQDSDEENKYYYDKLYTCSIAIQSECYSSTGENCELQKMVDLTNSARRNLEENDNIDLKDIPLPICLFNLTNNDVITSISCPESLPETKKRKIVLDLYFFRPPGLKRLKENNIDNEITRKTVGNRKYIKETNEGICDIENGHFSHCTTDMNTITDLENNILFYDEEAVMNITIDANNSNIKIKITNLTDESSKIENLNPQIYEEKINNIIQKLNPYLKYEVLFSKDDFGEFYIISKNGTDALKQKRILDNIDDKIIKEDNELFNQFFTESGITVIFNLINNAGINTDFMEANSNLKIEKINEDVSKSKESSRSFNELLKGLYLLSKAGNHLATEFYQKINTTLEEMIEKINQEFTLLNELVRYKDFSEIFDSTLSLDELKYLPFKIIQASTNLNQKLNEIINNVENGGIKQNIKILNKNIYDYIEESRIIINGLFNNLNELNTVLSSPKSKLTKISTYYLNNTSTSYISIIEKAKTILNNYYKDEYNLILQGFDTIKIEFEKKITKSVSKEMELIDILYERIENNNFTIKQANDDDIKTILNNLYETKNYLKKIKEKIIDKLTKEMDIKSNGYFISDYDMRSNQESFSKILEKTTKICEELDNNENIDKVFDEIMINLKRNFTKILKYMDQQKEKLFPLNEDVLKQSTFALEIQKNMKNNISQAGLEILKKIKRENNYYLEAKQKVIKEFLDKNKEDLDKTVLELDNLFSMAILDKLAQLYEEAFNSSLEKTKNEIYRNYLLSNEYFKTLSDENEIKKILRNYHTDDSHLPKYYKKRPLTDFTDNIYFKVKTQGYLSKYNIFKDNFQKSKLYVNEQLYRDLLSEYQSFILKIREILQVFKNNIISDKYPDLNELSFIDDHIRTIKTFYNRLNTYISDEIFNNKYIDIMNNFKETQNKLIENYIGDMESKHNIINSFPYINSYNSDFCVYFDRKITYTCPNGAVSRKTKSDGYCFPADSISSNYLKLSKHSIETDSGISHFRSEFKQFNDLLNEKIYYYTSKINEIKQSLLDIEPETIKQNFTLEYLVPIEDLVNSLLFNKYGDKIVNSSYNYYQSNIRENIEPLLNNISFQWKQYFQGLYTDIQNNRNNFTSSIADLPNMAQSYLSILNNNITKNYFNSIVKHQKSEFNYTIAYYYNIFLKLVKSSHQNVINKLPSNPIGFNNIINKRKEEVNSIFNALIKKIEDSKNEALNLGQQLYILYVPETNFFKVNDILRNNDLNNNNILSQILSNIYSISSNKENDEFSLSSRYYLENSEIGRQIQELYKQIVEKVFVYLNLENFKNILNENWIFDQDGFIKNLNDILYNSNLEIQKELKLEEEKYISSLEQEIKKTYSKEEISQKINENYKTGVKKLELNQINDIKKNINDILDKIKQEFTEEANLLKQTSNSYNKNFTKIQERLTNYKSQIIENLKSNIFGVINAFYQDINNKIYINYCSIKLDEYISDTENTTSQFGEIKLLNSSYNIGEIIENMIKSIINNYKNFIQNEINSNYNVTYSEIKKEYENFLINYLIINSY